METIHEEGIKCFNCKLESENLVQCKICNEAFCTLCASASVTIFSSLEGKGEYKVCTGCQSCMVSLEDFIEREGIKWCHITQRGESWMKKSGA